jgi:CheY-like chemotaxis protein
MPKARIMIVEDEVIVARTMQAVLESEGYCVTSLVATGEEAVRRIPEEQPDLVLLDIVLRGYLNGIEVAHEIKSLWGLPVIFTTASTDEDTLSLAKMADPAGYLIKPVHPRDLGRVIKSALSKTTH